MNISIWFYMILYVYTSVAWCSWSKSNCGKLLQSWTVSAPSAVWASQSCLDVLLTSAHSCLELCTVSLCHPVLAGLSSCIRFKQRPSHIPRSRKEIHKELNRQVIMRYSIDFSLRRPIFCIKSSLWCSQWNPFPFGIVSIHFWGHIHLSLIIIRLHTMCGGFEQIFRWLNMANLRYATKSIWFGWLGLISPSPT